MKKILLSSAICASMLFAANSEYKYEITPMLGYNLTEGNLDLENYAIGGASLGFNLDNSLFDQVEVGILNSLSDVKYDGIQHDVTITRTFANLVKDYELSSSTSLYALVGAGLEWFSNESFGNERGLFGNYGIGIKYKLTDSMTLKADIRHLIETDHADNNLITTIGIGIPFGKKTMAAPTPEPMPMKEEPKVMDGDADGVPDAIDQCQTTPLNAIVDARGCELDGDKDGIVDRLDRCPNTPKGDIVDNHGCSLKADLNINFETNSAVINNSYDSKIKKFADFMKAFPSVKGKIEAHTDSRGSDAYNQKLSERRAESAVKALEAYGVDRNRLNAVGYGETSPKASNDTDEGRAENRRVEGTIQR